MRETTYYAQERAKHERDRGLSARESLACERRLNVRRRAEHEREG